MDALQKIDAQASGVFRFRPRAAVVTGHATCGILGPRPDPLELQPKLLCAPPHVIVWLLQSLLPLRTFWNWNGLGKKFQWQLVGRLTSQQSNQRPSQCGPVNVFALRDS